MDYTKYVGKNVLADKLKTKRIKVRTRYNYYDMKNIVHDFNISTPPELRWWMGCLGWCAKSVDSLNNRLNVRGFKEDNFGIGEIYNLNNPDVLFKSATHGAMIASCDFLYISQDENGFPRMQVIDGSNATGIMDPITGLLKEGYAVIERDERGNPTIEAWFIPGQTHFYKKGASGVQIIENVAEYPLLVPIVYRPDAMRPFGHSRISRACMDLVNSAIRTVKRSEIAAEFFSFPQKYMIGASGDLEIDKWSAAMSAMLTVTKDDDGEKPTLGQFSQQSMGPHLEQLEMFASLFAGECDLTLDDMGFSKSNPSSAEAIKASHEALKQTALAAQRTFGRGFVNAGFLAACLRDGIAYKRNQFYMTETRWFPIFEPDAAQMSGLGDALLKIEQAVPGVITTELLEDLTGYTLA